MREDSRLGAIDGRCSLEEQQVSKTRQSSSNLTWLTTEVICRKMEYNSKGNHNMNGYRGRWGYWFR